METTVSVLNTIQASAADISLKGGLLKITGCPDIEYANIERLGSPGIPLLKPDALSTRGFNGAKRFLKEYAQVYTIAFTYATSKVLGLTISQIDSAGNMKTRSYQIASLATEALFCAAIKAIVEADFNITVTGSATPVTLTANAGYTFFTAADMTGVTTMAGVTIAVTQTTIPPHGTKSTAVQREDEHVLITTLAAHGLVTGDVVNISWGITSSFLIDGSGDGGAGYDYRITYASATTFYLDDCVGSGGANDQIVTIKHQATPPRGRYANIEAIKENSGAVATVDYTEFDFYYRDRKVDMLGKSQMSDLKRHRLFVSASLVASPYTATTNYTDFENRLTELLTGKKVAAMGRRTIAPHGDQATSIAGTTPVTVTTLNSHFLKIGDLVAIAGVNTMTINGLAMGIFRVATVPTATTFTLADCLGSGTNAGDITITQLKEEVGYQEVGSIV